MKDAPHIILIGLRGSGKSTLAALISTALEAKYIDLDREIEKKAGTQIAKIIATHGWEYFRKLEKEVVKELEKNSRTVIATGGGTLLDLENTALLREHSLIIYLHTEPKLCASRIAHDQNRPSLTENPTLLKEMEALYKERHLIYSSRADIIYTPCHTPEKDAHILTEMICAQTSSS